MRFAIVGAIATAALASSPQAGQCLEFIGLIVPQIDRVLKRPEIVRLEFEKVYSRSDVKTVIVGNAVGRYTLSCNLKAAGCMTPIPGRDYYVIKEESRWRMPGAMHDIDLATLQDFTATYFSAENIGLVRVDSRGEPGAIGMYTLGSWNKK
jgi:hypothetical protein